VLQKINKKEKGKTDGTVAKPPSENRLGTNLTGFGKFRGVK
jgi:hypothetical protein